MTDSILAKVVAQVESSGFPYALKYEPNLYQLTQFNTPINIPIITAIRAGNHCDHVTACAIYSTSYGLFQILGMNLYEVCHWRPSVAIYCYDTEAQLDCFNTYCRSRQVDPASFNFSDDEALDHFARAYNGPGDVPNYVAKLKAAYANLPKEV